MDDVDPRSVRTSNATVVVRPEPSGDAGPAPVRRLRLMVLGTCVRAGVYPQQLTGWFHSLVVDAYDRVMVPNVIGMTASQKRPRLAGNRRMRSILSTLDRFSEAQRRADPAVRS